MPEKPVEDTLRELDQEFDHPDCLSEYCYFWFRVVHCGAPLLEYSAPDPAGCGISLLAVATQSFAVHVVSSMTRRSQERRAACVRQGHAANIPAISPKEPAQ